jgi:hypothetical protein
VRIRLLAHQDAAVKVPRRLRKHTATLRRMARTNAVRVPGLCVLFFGGVVAAITFTREPEAPAPRSFTMGWDGATSTDGSERDPAGQFEQRRVGQLLFASTTSDTCRRVLFHNRTGKSYQAGEVPCGQPGPDTVVSGGDRMQALRKAFNKEPAVTP